MNAQPWAKTTSKLGGMSRPTECPQWEPGTSSCKYSNEHLVST